MKSAAVASEPAAEEAAKGVLSEGGTAADAVIAGFLAASAGRPGALFAPLVALFAGPGAGARAFDGRARQPGRGLPRPRGFVKDDAVPETARAAVPASLGALALLHAYGGTFEMDRLLAPALERARGGGQPERGAVLRKILGTGPLALHQATIARPILAVAGRTTGGLVSEEDLTEVRPESAPPRSTSFGGHRALLTSPWPAPGEPGRVAEIIVAVDVAGVMAALSYLPDDEGVPVPELGLTLPRDAIVVRRGVPRVAPGEPLPCAGPIGIGIDERAAFLGLGVRGPTGLDVEALRGVWSEPMATAATLLAAAKDAARGTSARGVVRSHATEQSQALSA